MYLSTLNSFRVIRCLSECVSPKIAIFYIFVSPGDAPGRNAICCMNGKQIRCLQIVPQNVPIHLQQFISYSNHKCKKSAFSRTTAHIFVSSGDAPATITQCVTWMERQFNACETPRSMYLSILNTFRVIRCLSKCVSPKIAIFKCFPWGRPWEKSCNMLHEWKADSMLTNCTGECAHSSSTVYQLFEPQV